MMEKGVDRFAHGFGRLAWTVMGGRKSDARDG